MFSKSYGCWERWTFLIILTVIDKMTLSSKIEEMNFFNDDIFYFLLSEEEIWYVWNNRKK